MTRLARMQRKIDLRKGVTNLPSTTPATRMRKTVARAYSCLRRFAGPLLGRYGFDDELPAILRIERHFRAVPCRVHQALNVGVVQHVEIFQSDVPHYSALALKTPLRVRNPPRSLNEAQSHPAGKQHDRENGQ